MNIRKELTTTLNRVKYTVIPIDELIFRIKLLQLLRYINKRYRWIRHPPVASTPVALNISTNSTNCK